MLKKNKQIVAFLFMMVILLIKVAGIHSYLHELHHDQDHHEIVHCQTCDDIQYERITPFLPTSTPTIECVTHLLPREVNVKIDEVEHITGLYVSDLINRPPPIFS